MHELNPFEAFEPSRSTKSVWRYTRKKPTNYRGLPLPGLFQTEHAMIDASGFMMVIVLELWGLQSLLAVGDIAFAYVAGLFVADVLFAVLRHFPQGQICEEQNRLLVADDIDTTTKLAEKIKKKKLIPHIFTLPILAIAAFKIFGFFALQGGEFTGETLAIGLSYGVAALLHITVTGQFLFALVTSVLLRKDRQQYLDSEKRHFVPRVFIFESAATIKETKVDRHNLNRKNKGSSVESTWAFETYGVLMDSQLDTFINSQQNREACFAVARAGVEHQLQILQSEPHYSVDSFTPSTSESLDSTEYSSSTDSNNSGT